MTAASARGRSYTTRRDTIVRLACQTAVVTLVVLMDHTVVWAVGEFSLFPQVLGMWAMPFTILFVITIVNAFNLIDGIDGLAGGLALLALGALAFFARQTQLCEVILLYLGGVTGFLLFNLPLTLNRRVRIFLGDAGSTSIGLAIAIFGILLSQGETPRIAPVTGLWLVAVPVEADHSHMHHVLVDGGLSRRRTLAVLLFMGVVFGGIGVAGENLGVSDGASLLFWISCGVLFYQVMRRPEWLIRCASRLQSPAWLIAPLDATKRTQVLGADELPSG
jgi:UDP-GlcNAc:undecaprenyl-phosphate GlcNAc-1-phosphate transferase